MATMADAIKEALRERGGLASREEIRAYIDSKYPDEWQPATLQASLYACAINNPKAYLHHRSAERFLFQRPDGRFEFYDQAQHGENEWEPVDEGLGSDETALEASISMERDLEDHLARDLTIIEPGLVLVDRQVRTDVGIIDLLAKDREGRSVALELKVGEAKDSAIGQAARYLGWLAKERPSKVGPRAILVASEFPDGVRLAASVIPGLSLVAYKVAFRFETIR